MKLISGALLLFIIAGAAPASAQVAYHLSLAPGTQVRVETNQQRGKKIVGEVYGVARDTLSMFGHGHSTSYAIADIHKLEIRNGIDRKRGMLIGTLIGGAVGFLENTEERGSVTAGTAMIGTLIGFAFAPKGWERIPLPAHR